MKKDADYYNVCYPKTYPHQFECKFDTKKDVMDFCLSRMGTFKKNENGNGYTAFYTSEMDNFVTTGRKFYVIDKKGNLHHQIITKIKNVYDDNLFMLDGFDGEFKYAGAEFSDICVNTNCIVDMNYLGLMIKELDKLEQLPTFLRG